MTSNPREMYDSGRVFFFNNTVYRNAHLVLQIPKSNIAKYRPAGLRLTSYVYNGYVISVTARPVNFICTCGVNV